jgi:ABC-2 type transport system ATP-binding protein
MYGVKVKPLEILEMVNLTDKAKSKFDKLSGGQKQRFSICTTLINKPKIVFLDEPTTGLDPQARRSLWDLIKDVRNRGTTVVLTTHYMDEAEELCDRIAIFDQGQILRLDTPDNLIDNLLSKGFSKPKHSKDADLEDVFLDLTGKALRE